MTIAIKNAPYQTIGMEIHVWDVEATATNALMQQIVWNAIETIILKIMNSKKSCEPCQVGCIECIAEDICRECISDMVLEDGVCICRTDVCKSKCQVSDKGCSICGGHYIYILNLKIPVASVLYESIPSHMMPTTQIHLTIFIQTLFTKSALVYLEVKPLSL